MIRVMLVIGASFVAATYLGAAAPKTTPDAPAKPKAPPIVAIKKADGSSVRGQLVDSDGLHLTLKPSEGATYGEPVEVPWSQIKSVSNGLTQQKAATVWKAEHKGDLCDACHGERVVPCAACKGTGHDPASSKDCKTCKGEGTIACKQPKCDKGMVPCPGPCLKLTEGTWSKPDADGKRWRSIPMGKKGTWKYSDAHLGEVLKIDQGAIVGSEPCQICGKTGKVVCPTCGGRAVVACPTCKADKTAADCAACEDGTEVCPKCNGSGLKTATPKKVELQPEPAKAPQPKPADPKATSKTGDGLD